MKTFAGILLFASLALLPYDSVSARNDGHKRKIIASDFKENIYAEIADPELYRLHSVAQVDTYNIVKYDFEIRDWQNWTRLDRTAQIDTFFHVDDFSDLAGGDFGRLLPLEGSKSMWCGSRANAGDMYLCGWSDPPGYGNAWRQILVSDEIEFSGSVSLIYKGLFDTETDWDHTFIEYDAGDGDWIEFTAYDGVLTGTFSHQLQLSQASTKFRFNFVSDGWWSDEDGLHDTDGACIIDSIVIADASGTIDFENFEATPVGAHRADGDGNDIFWKADIGESYGLHSGLFNYLLQEYDPCNKNQTTQVTFFLDSPNPSSSYPGLFDTPFCKGRGGTTYPCQDEMIISPVIDLTKYSTNNDSNQDADIPAGELADLNGVYLRYTVYRDLPLENLVFYYVYVRNINSNGCPREWRGYNYVYYGSYEDYFFAVHNIGNFIEEDKIQVALCVVDMCQYWYLYYGNCGSHTPAPWFDNVRIQQFAITGPQWQFRSVDLFQDRFPASYSDMESFVRADAARDISAPYHPGIHAGDSTVVTCTSPHGGGIVEDPDGWPHVYMHVSATYIGPPDPPYGPKPALYGPQIEGTYGRYHSDDGAQWTVIQCDRVRTSWGGVLAHFQDLYTADLNDSLFTRGYCIEYYFSAEDSSGAVSYLPPDPGARADRSYRGYKGVSYLFEWTCLPTFNSDILYVDDFHGRGSFWGTVEEYMNATFTSVIPSTNLPDRYDVLQPASAVGNGLASSAGINQLCQAYRTIIWDSGDLRFGTIGDGMTGSDKANDCMLLVNWMYTKQEDAGLWILGNHVASDLDQRSSIQAIALMNSLCGVDLIDDPNAASYFGLTGGLMGNGIVTPLITGTSEGIFSHDGIPDQWLVYGGCPIINDFDVLGATENGVIAAEYPPFGPYSNLPSVIQSVMTNSNECIVKTIWFGQSFMYVRDAEHTPGEPVIRNHIMKDIIEWFGNEVDPNITEAAVPFAYNLEQNHPNPFNPSTTIRFDVKERGHVSLKIFNVAGQLVKTLVDGVKEASSYSIPWDGTNNLGAKVASGVYFYKMESVSFSRTKKLVLLR